MFQSPMLAHEFYKHEDKLIYPCLIQPKLDGIRCVAVKTGSEVVLYSRNGNVFNSCPHINKAILEQFPEDITLDGELYNKELLFEELVSVAYHIFDVMRYTGFRERFEALPIPTYPLIKVTPYRAFKREIALSLYNTFKEQGYEGIMLRNENSFYKSGRSYDLLKYKEFITEEFPIIGVKKGKGRLKDCLGAFICVTVDGIQFEAKPIGTVEHNKQYLAGGWQNKLLTVKFQEYTNKQIPRFPIGIEVRDYE